MGRVYQAYGKTFNLKPECALESEDFRKLSTLAKLEKQAEETRATAAQLTSNPDAILKGELTLLAQALERQEGRAKRLRGELSEVLA